MKRFIVMLLIFGTVKSQAQFSGSSGALKAGAGYTQDFPGLNGYTMAGEYSFPLIEHLQGSIGMKHANMQGYPRTNQAFEYTRATTLDFNFYYAPLLTEKQLFRIGLGYSFSFYSIQRSYPLTVDYSTGKSTTWPIQQAKGRTTGINLIAEYEIKIPNTNFSAGIRGALYKAYDGTYFIGPMIGYQF
jgi:hypothetical protein